MDHNMEDCYDPIAKLWGDYPPPPFPCPELDDTLANRNAFDFVSHMTPRSIDMAMGAIAATNDNERAAAGGPEPSAAGPSDWNLDWTTNYDQKPYQYDQYDPYDTYTSFGGSNDKPQPHLPPFYQHHEGKHPLPNCNSTNLNSPNNNILPPVMVDNLDDQFLQELQQQDCSSGLLYVMPVFQQMPGFNNSNHGPRMNGKKKITPFDVLFEQNKNNINTTNNHTHCSSNSKLEPGGGTGQFKCEYCGHRFKRLYTLNTHVRIHTGAKPYICEICGQGFRQSGTKHNHIRAIHMQERPFECTLCAKTFAHKSTLQVHLRTHTKEKPYPCDVCGKRFSDRATYLKHQAVHTGEKPFKCPACTKCFAQKSNLKRHYNNIHHSVI